jgi:hypothetical protein
MSAQRSVNIIFDNQTSQDLALITVNILHGNFAGQPPQNIGPNIGVTLEVDSDEFSTSVEGSITYSIRSSTSQFVVLAFDSRPFLSESSYTGSAPAGYSLAISVTGNTNAIVTYFLTVS